MTRHQYRNFPAELAVREVEVESRVLVTTMLEPRQVSKGELNRLYGRRWNVGVSSQGHVFKSVKVRPRSRDSDLVAWEAPWRESKTVEPSDNML